MKKINMYTKSNIKLLISLCILIISFYIVKEAYAQITSESDVGTNYKIEGVVLDNEQLPLKDIPVSIYKNSEKIETLSTDSNGKFFIENLETGEYFFKVESENRVESITRNMVSGTYNINKDISIGFINGQSVLLEEIANKLRSIYKNQSKEIKIYESNYENEVNPVNTLIKNITRDKKNKKAIIASVHGNDVHKFNLQIENKRKALGQGPFSYKFFVQYQDVQADNIEDLEKYSDFFENCSEIGKSELLEKLYKYLEINDNTEIVQENILSESNTSKRIQVEENHDNDNTNNIVININQNETIDNNDDNLNNEDQNNSEIIVPSTSNGEDTPEEGSTVTQPQTPENGEVEIVIPQTQEEIDKGEPEIKIKTEKKLTAVKLELSNGQILMDEQGDSINWDIDNELRIMYIDEELMHGSTISLEYSIFITNNSNVDLENVEISDCLNYTDENNLVYDSEMKFLTNPNEKNSDFKWRPVSYGKYNCLNTTIDKIPVGETVELKLALSRVISANTDEMRYTNYLIVEKANITYTDSNGIEQNEDKYFNYINENNFINKYYNKVNYAGIVLLLPPG